jgi:hypothetical protein
MAMADGHGHGRWPWPSSGSPVLWFGMQMLEQQNDTADPISCKLRTYPCCYPTAQRLAAQERTGAAVRGGWLTGSER